MDLNAAFDFEGDSVCCTMLCLVHLEPHGVTDSDHFLRRAVKLASPSKSQVEAESASKGLC